MTHDQFLNVVIDCRIDKAFTIELVEELIEHTRIRLELASSLENKAEYSDLFVKSMQLERLLNSLLATNIHGVFE